MKDFKTLLQDAEADKTLEEKIRNECQAIANSGEKLSDADILLKAIKSLGYDITLSDIEKFEVESQELDMTELEAVSGGEEDIHDWCAISYSCYVIILHPSGRKEGDPCFKDYSCIFAERLD